MGRAGKGAAAGVPGSGGGSRGAAARVHTVHGVKKHPGRKERRSEGLDGRSCPGEGVQA